MAPKGPASLKVLENALADETRDLLGPVREMGAIYVEQIARLTEVIERLANEIEVASRTDAQLSRLWTIPGIGRLDQFQPVPPAFRPATQPLVQRSRLSGHRPSRAARPA